MAPSYTLHYFDGRGQAELSRLVFILAGQEFTDKRFTREEWPPLKENYLADQVPSLDVDDKSLVQSCAIARYLANEFGLNGECNWEHAVCDMYCDMNNQVLISFGNMMFAKAEEEKAKHLESSQKVCASFAKLIKNTKKGKYILGDKVSLADLAVFDAVTFMETALPDCTKEHSVFAEITGVVNEISSIVDYVTARKDTQF